MLGILFILIVIGSSLFALIFVSSNQLYSPSSPYNHFSILFASTTSYSQALSVVTNLGLQPSIVCQVGSEQESQKGLRLWQPVGQKTEFLNKHIFTVESSVYTPSNWMQRLRTTTGIRDIKQITDSLPVCSSSQLTYGTPTPGVAVPLSGAESTMYARVSFASPLNSYDNALYAVSNLGLLLANPCYKQAQEQADTHTITFPWNSKPSWHPMSQEHEFSTSHELLIETSPTNTSTVWLSQLQALLGVADVKMAKISCT
jgi:hypothetical protein